MSRAILTLNTHGDRARAMQWITKAPAGTRVEFRASRRSVEQNDKMWAMLTDVAQQLPWYGKKLAPEDWKIMFLKGLERENQAERRIVPNLEGDGYVDLGVSS